MRRLRNLSVLYKLPNQSIRRVKTGLSFEIRIAIHETIYAFLHEKTGLDLYSVIHFFTDFAFFDQFLVRTLITRH